MKYKCNGKLPVRPRSIIYVGALHLDNILYAIRRTVKQNTRWTDRKTRKKQNTPL